MPIKATTNAMSTAIQYSFNWPNMITNPLSFQSLFDKPQIYLDYPNNH